MNDTTDTTRTVGASVAHSLRRAAQWLADGTVNLIRHGNRRRITLRGRNGDVWLRLPLTLAALLVLVATINWLALLVLVLVVVFAAGAQVSVERVGDDRTSAERQGAGAPPTAA
jgi:hypothetical protein